MNRHRLTLISSLAVALILMATLVVQPLPTVPAVHAQDTIKDEDGFTNRPLDDKDTEASFEEAEAFDADSVQDDPTARTGHQVAAPPQGGLDYVANGVGTRNAGFGTIRLRGVPPGAQVVRAYLYWGTMQAAAAPTQTVAFRGNPVTGRLIGSAGPTCWGPGVFAAYQASVIGLITPGINNDYLVSRMPTSLVDGRSPWPGGAPLPLSEGASLVVIYAHSSVPWTAQVFINHGAAFFYNSITINNPLAAFLRPYGRLKHTRIGADGQVGNGTNSILPVTDERTFLGPPFFTQIKGPASPFNGDSDWNGDDGVPLNQLWDTHTDSFGRIINPGVANYLVRYRANGDCIFPVAHILGTQ